MDPDLTVKFKAESQTEKPALKMTCYSDVSLELPKLFKNKITLFLSIQEDFSSAEYSNYKCILHIVKQI